MIRDSMVMNLICVMLIAILINIYFFNQQHVWIVGIVFILSQMSDIVIRQKIFLLMVIIMAFCFFGLISFLFSRTMVMAMIMMSVIISAVICYLNRPLSQESIFLTLLFPVVLLLSTLFPEMDKNILYSWLMDAVIALVLSILVQFIFSKNLVKKFRIDMSLLFSILNHDVKYLFDEGASISRIKLSMLSMRYPEWIVRMGLNPGLRSGFRFFLVRLEQIIELLFSLDYFIRSNLNQEILNHIKPELLLVNKQNAILLDSLSHYFKQKTQVAIQDDLTSDVLALDKKLREMIPARLALLDVSYDDMKITMIVRDIKDIRLLLLQLIAALPTT